MSSTERCTSTKLFHEKLSMLNDNFIKFLQKEYAKKPNADLTPVLNDYLKHLRDLDSMYSLPAESDFSTYLKSSQVICLSPPLPISSEKTNMETTSTTTTNVTITTTTSAIPTFPFGSFVPKPTLFGVLPISSEKTTNMEKTSTTTTSLTSTTTFASVPTFSFGSTPKPLTNLFGGFSSFSSTTETAKENNGKETNERPEEFIPKDNVQPIVSLPSVNKFPSIPSLFSLKKTTGENTLTTTSLTSTTTFASVPTFSFGSTPKPLTNLFGGFSSLSSTIDNDKAKENNENDEEETDERPEEFIPKDNVQPIVPLPSKVETKSGEENEEILFEARCRLFRFDKSVKEFRARGTGDIKVLLNKQTNRYRCVARNNEAISKLITNFTIFASFKLEIKEGKPSCLIWRCKDFSEMNVSTDETFLAKFRDEETAQRFKEKIEEIVSGLPSSQANAT